SSCVFGADQWSDHGGGTMKRALWIIVFAATACSVESPHHSTTTPGPLAPVGRAVIHRVPILAEPVRSPATEPGASAPCWAQAQKDALGLSSQDDFALIALDHGIDGRDHVRLQQTIGGVKVWGGDVVVHATSSTLAAIDGNVLALKGLDLKPTRTVDD